MAELNGLDTICVNGVYLEMDFLITMVLSMEKVMLCLQQHALFNVGK